MHRTYASYGSPHKSRQGGNGTLPSPRRGVQQRQSKFHPPSMGGAAARRPGNGLFR